MANRLILILVVLLGVTLGVYWTRAEDAPAAPPVVKDEAADKLRPTIEKLRAIHTILGPAQPGDWLARYKEPGQTFDEYLAAKPVTPRGKRRFLYIQPLGDFTATQKKIVTLTADFMGRYFNLPVKIQKDLPLSTIPATAQRVHPQWGDKQILSTYVLDDLLAPKLPDDAAACIAFTSQDLWPGEGWNFVFGQASLRQRVGVWSIYRNGNPDKDAASFRLCLLRTLKTATHETGHMFSIQHCIKYECNMCGSNSRTESDKRPLEVCPECVAKILWATQTDAIERFKKLAEFCKAEGLTPEQEFYEKSITTLQE